MKLIRFNQGTPEWKDWRRGGLGGSDVATILGIAPFEDCTRANLIREKVDGWEKPTNFAMRRGNHKEPAARYLYEQIAECAAPPVCVEHDDAPWMRVSLDGLCRDQRRPEMPEWILELKAPNWQAHSMALAGVVPDYYRPQCQWQLLVTGLDRLDYASYSENSRYKASDSLAIVTVEPDSEMQAMLLDEAEKFWREVQARKALAQAQAQTAGAELVGGF